MKTSELSKFVLSGSVLQQHPEGKIVEVKTRIFCPLEFILSLTLKVFFHFSLFRLLMSRCVC